MVEQMEFERPQSVVPARRGAVAVTGQGSRPGYAGAKLAAPEAPTKPAETPVEIPAPKEPPPGERGDEDTSEPDIDEQIKRIIRELPDPTPQPGGE